MYVHCNMSVFFYPHIICFGYYIQNQSSENSRIKTDKCEISPTHNILFSIHFSTSTKLKSICHGPKRYYEICPVLYMLNAHNVVDHPTFYSIDKVLNSTEHCFQFNMMLLTVMRYQG